MSLELISCRGLLAFKPVQGLYFVLLVGSRNQWKLQGSPERRYVKTGGNINAIKYVFIQSF